ncbi:hypothetical protein [Methylobacterium nigriterrae]|uniref:hypothetical protein n=1 Tax=Methylobacterium nigriterrae TaxID=3127512 RepID=UPI0030135251
MVERARHTLTALQRGQAGYRHERIAAQEMVKLADQVEAAQVVETTFALFLLEDRQPRRFRSDQAFRFQLVRRLRGLTDLNAGVWFNHKTGRTHRAYRELPPRAVATFAQWVVEAIGGIGLYLAKLEREQEEAKQQRMNALVGVLETLR